MKSTKTTNAKTTKTNATKTNANYNDLFNVLMTTSANKNKLTLELNKIGYIANMKTKTPNDYITETPNDYYYQLSSGTRILINAKRTKCQLWLTDNDKQMIVDEKLYNENDIVSCNDSIRHYKTSMNIEFTNEWLNNFMNVYSKYHLVKIA